MPTCMWPNHTARCSNHTAKTTNASIRTAQTNNPYRSGHSRAIHLRASTLHVYACQSDHRAQGTLTLLISCSRQRDHDRSSTSLLSGQVWGWPDVDPARRASPRTLPGESSELAVVRARNGRHARLGMPEHSRHGGRPRDLARRGMPLLARSPSPRGCGPCVPRGVPRSGGRVVSARGADGVE